MSVNVLNRNTVACSAEMSKAAALRRFVTERLAAASRDILAAVESLAAGYEEQLDRQRRQLERLQQPGVALIRPGANCSGSDRREEDEDEEGGAAVCPENQENTKSRTPSRGQLEKRKPGRARTSTAQKHLHLRVCVLEDSHGDLLSQHVLEKCSIVKLKCPRGLQEAEFLALLRSSFPQLARDNAPFDILTANERQRLQTLTPEELHSNMCRTDVEKSTLYIRLKAREEPRCNERENAPLQTQDICTNEFLVHEAGGSSPAARQHDLEADEADDAGETAADSAAELHAGEREQAGPKSEARADVLRCRVCGELHQVEVTFAKHVWSHVGDAGSPCGMCGASAESAEALKRHIDTRHALSPGEHVAAHSGHGPRAPLDDHLKLREAGEALECLTCQRVFELKEQLDAHRRTHAGRRTHLCGVCGKALSDYRSLSRHRFTHTGERPHGCQVCGRRFKLKGALRQHEKTHAHRERSYLCDVCCKMFLTSKQLQIHMRTHTKEKPYRCSECGKGFATRGPLTIHMRVHTGEAPYRCPDCGWSFKRKSNLDDHLTVHSGVKAFLCGICGKACARKTHLTVHMRTHNGERPYKCAVCDRAFTQSHCLKTHMRSHQGGDAPV